MKTVWIDDDLHEALYRLAEKEGRTIQGQANRLLRTHPESAVFLGVVGSGDATATAAATTTADTEHAKKEAGK